MNGSQQTTINEIKKLIEEDNIEIDAALRLTLASQLIITEELTGIRTHAVKSKEGLDKRMDCLEDDVAGLRECVNKRVTKVETHLGKYPSIVWFWIHRRKTLILMLLAIMLVYTILFGWVNISDIRQAILSQLGLPPDLGLAP